MAYLISEEAKDLLQDVHEFCENEVKEQCKAYDVSGEWPKEIYDKAIEMQLHSLEVPEEYGGPGLSRVDVAALIEEMAIADAGFATTISASGLGTKPVLIAGNEEQKKHVCQKIIDGGFGAFCLTEPGAGSDASAGTTTAVKDGDEWVLNGRKCFITNGGIASFYCITAMTDKTKGVKGISMFLVDAGTPGLSTGNEENKMGIRTSNTCDVVLEDCRIPAANLVGEEGRGFSIAMKTLDQARAWMGCVATGIAQRGINEGIAYAKERVQFGSDPKNPIKTLNQINDVIKGFGEKIEGIGISCPGPLDLINGIILTPPNLPGWHNFELTKELEKITGISVQLENDANLAGLAETVIGAGKGKKIVEFLTISTGVGAGLCIDGQIYRGAKGFAQEVANCILWKNGPSQGDLKKGSIESIASGTAITKRANDAGLEAAHAGEVYQLAQEGNETAAMIMEDAYEYLSSFIATLYGVLDPELFVLSGSVALKIPGFIEEIEKRAKEKVYDALKSNVKIVPAALGEDCGLIGAACLAFFDLDKKKK